VIHQIDQTLCFRDFDFKVADRQFARGPTAPEDVRLVVVDARDGSIAHDTFPNLASYFGSDDLLLENSAGIGRSRLQGVADNGVRIDVCFLLDRSENCWECVMLGDGVQAPEAGAFELAGGAVKGRIIERTQDFDGPYWIEKNRYHGYRGLVEISVGPKTLRAELDARGSYMHPWYTNLNDLPEETLNPAGITSATAALLAEPARRMNGEIRNALHARGVDRAVITLFMSFSWQQSRPDQRLADYQMNPEEIAMAEDEVAKLRSALAAGKRVTGIGTSGIRVVESLPSLERGYSGLTDCFVAPGFRFRHSHGLLTNLHNPMGTHVIMAAAIGGHDLVMKAYRECVELGYHFGIHGDSMLVFAPNA
jgi:S-adenosylmethionine:tRNA ribosyltransferase-isomerase